MLQRLNFSAQAERVINTHHSYSCVLCSTNRMEKYVIRDPYYLRKYEFGGARFDRYLLYLRDLILLSCSKPIQPNT